MTNEPKKEEELKELIDLYIFKDYMEEIFLNKLDTLPQEVKKLLIISKECFPRLNYIAKIDELKKRNTDIALWKEDIFDTFSNIPKIIFLIPPNTNYLETIDKNITNCKGKTTDKFYIFFIPQISNECYEYIKSSSNQIFYNIENLNLDLYVLNNDIISLEDNNAFYDLYIKNDMNNLSILAKIILKMESIFGKFRYKYYKGTLSKRLKWLILNEEDDLSIDYNSNKNNNFETLGCIFLDRNVDMITPFCSNFVYEGLIDEHFGINLNVTQIPAKIIGKDKDKEKKDKIKIDISEGNKFYTKIKDYNFSQLKSFLLGRYIEFDKTLKEGKEKVTDLKKIQENLKKIKKIQEESSSLNNNLNIAEYISKNMQDPVSKNYLIMEQSILAGDTSDDIYDFIDNELTKKAEEFKFLKILCFVSCAKNGIKSKEFDKIKKEFFLIYGFQEIFLWNNLEKAEILKQQESSFFNYFNKKLKLINEDVNLNEPDDISYSFSGYAPISVRLIEKAITKGWNSIDDVLKRIPGDCYYPKDESNMIKIDNKVQYILIVFIGGITYGELSSIRYLNRKLKNKKFIILTTSIINYKKIFNSLRRGKFNYIPNDTLNINGDTIDNKSAFNNNFTFQKAYADFNE